MNGGYKRVKETSNKDLVNELLANGTWRLLDVKTAKEKRPIGKVKVGVTGVSEWERLDYWNKYEITYEETLKTLYIIGRFEKL